MTLTKKTKRTRKNISPLLEKILSDRSNVVFNVPKKARRANSNFFDNARLNKAIIFKYPNFEMDIADFVAGESLNKQDRPVETCLYFPYDSVMPQDGGHGVYLREADFAAKLRYFIGIDLETVTPETARDLELLGLIDDIPSLDPFLMRVKFEEADLEVDGDFLGLDKVEELSIKSIITRDVFPIITKAFPEQVIKRKSRSLADFINGLWNSQSPEAAMFIEAFGLDKSQSHRILTAWKGVAYYEYKYAENIRKSTEMIRWLQSKDSEPYDLAMFGHLKDLYQMNRKATIEQMKALTASTASIFKNYRDCHSQFLENKPEAFRKFLQNANDHFWALGFCVNALDHCNYLFESEVADKPGMKLRYDQFEIFLGKIKITVDRNINPENHLN